MNLILSINESKSDLLLFNFIWTIRITIYNYISAKADVLLLVFGNHTYITCVKLLTKFSDEQMGIMST